MFCRFAAGAMLALLALVSAAEAGGCPGKPDAPGTSRIAGIDPLQQRHAGLLEYEETLPLRDHEVVLTFDDGPIPPYTTMVLDALAAECVKATFFVVGEQAQGHPDLLRREYREGHTIGTHTQHHRMLNRLPPGAVTKEIADGIASVDGILGPGAAAPFFRFPYLDPTPAAEDRALKLGLMIWSTDVHASDWNRLTPQQIAAIAAARIERNKKGILMLHDIQQRTALALPMILRELKGRGYRIVQVVPTANVPRAAAADGRWPAAVH